MSTLFGFDIYSNKSVEQVHTAYDPFFYNMSRLSELNKKMTLVTCKAAKTQIKSLKLFFPQKYFTLASQVRVEQNLQFIRHE